MKKRIVIIMPDGSMPWVDCKPCYGPDIFSFDYGDGYHLPVVFDGLGIDYFIVT